MNVDLMSMVLNWTSRKEDVEALTCEHCQEVMKNPQRLPCGHSFCRSCVPMLKKKCAICVRDFKVEQVSKDILAFNLIEELTLKCDHGSCMWTGSFTDYQTHLRKVHMKSPAKTDLTEKAETEDNLRRVMSEDAALENAHNDAADNRYLKMQSAPVDPTGG
jgi:late competence protein required for DNA uptake (superfamily II DNA/RNA helicase)